jgi:hypothetical protein
MNTPLDTQKLNHIFGDRPDILAGISKFAGTRPPVAALKFSSNLAATRCLRFRDDMLTVVHSRFPEQNTTLQRHLTLPLRPTTRCPIER